MTQRVAVITGAAQGLGLACSKAFADIGVAVAMLDMDEPALHKAAGSVEGSPSCFTADVSQQEKCQNAVTQINEKLGRIDILVNCAGVYPRVGIHDITEKDWRFVFDINVMGSYFMMVECAKAMKATGEGRIVNVSSIDAFTAHPSNAHYAATKAAVVSLTRSFALEVAKNGILVNSVAPGPMATERALKSDWFAQMTAELPTGVAIEPEEIARTVVYLCDPKNKSLTGENIIVSGGGVIA